MGHRLSERDFPLYLATDIFLLLPSYLSPVCVIFISSAGPFQLLCTGHPQKVFPSSLAFASQRKQCCVGQLSLHIFLIAGSNPTTAALLTHDVRCLVPRQPAPPRGDIPKGSSRRHGVHLQRTALLLEGADVPLGISRRRPSSTPCPRSTQLHALPRSRRLAACGRLPRPRE